MVGTPSFSENIAVVVCSTTLPQFADSNLDPKLVFLVSAVPLHKCMDSVVKWLWPPPNISAVDTATYKTFHKPKRGLHRHRRPASLICVFLLVMKCRWLIEGCFQGYYIAELLEKRASCNKLYMSTTEVMKESWVRTGFVFKFTNWRNWLRLAANV